MADVNHMLGTNFNTFTEQWLWNENGEPLNSNTSIACSSKINSQPHSSKTADTNKRNLSPKKRKLQINSNATTLAQSLFGIQTSPTKKRKVSHKQSQVHHEIQSQCNQNMNIDWRNHVILSKKCVNKMYNKITSILSIHKYGFKQLDEITCNAIVDQQMSNYQTMNGIKITQLEQKVAYRLVHGMRSYYLALTASEVSKKINPVLESKAFAKKFRYDLIVKGQILGDKEVQYWIQMCKTRGIPPYTLIQRWLKKNKIVKSNKEVNDWIRSIQKKQNDNKVVMESFNYKLNKLSTNHSFLDFCLRISLQDSLSFHYEVEKQIKSEQFERLVYDKVQIILNKWNAKYRKEVSMLSEEEQRKNNSKLTPDILLSESVCINDKKVHWIEVKNYLVTDRGFLWNKVKWQCTKYTNAFGCGAVVCRGFQHGLKTPFGGVLWLDVYDLLNEQIDSV